MGKKRFETAVIHEGYDAKQMLGSLSTPLFQTSTYEFQSAEHGEKCFRGEDTGYIYTRIGNPTVHVLEKRIAELEGAESGLAFSSGMGAISAVLIALTKANDHVLCSSGLYGCTFGLLMMMKEKYNMTVDFSDFTSKEEIRKQIKPETAVIYVETPINPTMKLIDLQLVAEVAKEFNIPVVVDNTFSSPYLQRPIELGCDVVVHSATKYLNGHGDVIAGLAVGKKDFLDEVAATTQKDIGAVLAPFDAWLLLRGMKTLPLRMDRHCDNAEKIVVKLVDHEKIAAVYYPKKDEGNVYSKQMSRGGGVIAFEIKGSKEDAQKMLNKLTFAKVAVSLGDAETLIEHPATMTHAVIPEEERIKMGIKDNLIRLSVGLEAWEDIWEDLEQALHTF
ncbi:methionine gamma-lyase [Pseudogracilibacillus auburnensis]|uniref:L-methionine gamma-lyase n=1 Tax=Pseudogracilibacillus auburnensis TaxID=1494959 RepID=A0A2V3W2Y7_9BACI|nr:methionine gamma-lyase [Pseudogracilibacillus auburnensis]MBO1002118.1 methionine gamma-lyase [Pseudogracilibacillus auburnensis]PXW87441.1 methionine-gamma-lyase [Pseudogracilibacillus auburnensis]